MRRNLWKTLRTAKITTKKLYTYIILIHHDIIWYLDEVGITIEIYMVALMKVRY